MKNLSKPTVQLSLLQRSPKPTGHACVFCSEHRECNATFPAAHPLGGAVRGAAPITPMKERRVFYPA